MKDIFKGYYNLSKPELEDLWKDEKTLFVFDTNVLLNLYGYAQQTKEDFFNILQAIEEKIWIPYHVGLEYQRRRLNIIKNEKSVFNDIESNLGKIQKIFKGDFERLALKRRFPKLFENTEKLEQEISKSISNYRKSVQYWDSMQPCVRSHDEIRDKLNKFFDKRVGDKPESQEWLDALYKDGAERFKKKIPPGFKDSGKGNNEEESHFYNDGLYYERQYGDLILWYQLIDRAKSESVENVIFITDDAKNDWWYEVDSNGRKIIGPLAELQSEIYRKSHIKRFHMYNTSTFLEDGKSNLAVDVSDSSIEDASTPHTTNDSQLLTPKQLLELINIYQQKSIVNDNQRELAERANKISSIDNDRIRELAERVNKLVPFDAEKVRELSERANMIHYPDVDKVKNFSEYIDKYYREALESQRSKLTDEYLRKIDWYIKNDEDGEL